MESFPPAPCIRGDSGRSRAGGIYVINRLFAEGWQDCTNLHRDVQTDAYATEAVIARMVPFVSQEYPSWSDALTRVGIGVVLLFIPREIEVCDLPRFLHLSVGNMYLRSNSDQAYMYGNGAFAPLTVSFRSRCSIGVRSTRRM